MDSILTLIKKLLGVEEEYTHFDQDITMHINSVLFILTQLGVGPSNGFIITSKSETWVDFLGDRKDLSPVQTFIYLKVRLLFDPPTSSFVLEAIERQIAEFEWRLNVQIENTMSVVEVI